MKTLKLAALLLAVGLANAAEPTLNDFWDGRAIFAPSTDTLNTDTRSGLHFLSNIRQTDGRYFVYYVRNEGAVLVNGTTFPLQTTGLAYTRDWKSFTDAGKVLPRGQAGSFDERMASFASVWKDGNDYHMVYEAAGNSVTVPGAVAYATSSDGIRWAKRGVIFQRSGAFEKGNVGTPSLFKEGGTWWLFYTGFDFNDVRIFGAKGTALHLLSRVNGGAPWINVSSGGWDSGTAGRRSVIKQEGYYWMVYEGSTDQVGDTFTNSRWSSGIARSRDLLTWEKWQGTGGPVLPQVSGFGNDGPEWAKTPDGKMNIFFRKPGNTTGRATLVWNSTPVQEWLFQAETQLSHQIGRRDADGWSAATALDGSGYLTYGPYITSVTPGVHSASWKLLIDNNSAYNGGDTVATIDVFDANANRSLVSKSLIRRDFDRANAYQLFTLTFAAKTGQRLEFRLHWKDRAYIRQDHVQMR